MKGTNEELNEIGKSVRKAERKQGLVGKEERGAMGVLSHHWHKDFHASKISPFPGKAHEPQPVRLVANETHYPRLKMPRTPI